MDMIILISYILNKKGKNFSEYIFLQVIKFKFRSKKWISFFILEKGWESNMVQYFFVEYYVNNFVSFVLF